MEYRFLEPLDVLYLRGNRLFGDAGAHGDALMPPWPSLAAGSLRSRMLVDAGCSPVAYGLGAGEPAEPLKSVLGSPDAPGSFRISLFTVARKNRGTVEPCLPLPADVVVRSEKGRPVAIRLAPARIPARIQCGNPLPQLPVLRTGEPFKPEAPFWLSSRGWRAYLDGDPIPADGLVRQSELWRYDTRLGIALNGGTRTAETGRIYTSETVALAAGCGFLAGVSGADGLVPKQGLLRFGGDGRGVRVEVCFPTLPETPWKCIQEEKRFCLLAISPALFHDGWLLPGIRTKGGGWIWEMEGLRARLVAASIKRPEVVSGWDLANQRPKPALRAVPAGSVYWLDGLEGSAETLKGLAESGLWESVEDAEQGPRRAEGFNSVLFAAWPKH